MTYPDMPIEIDRRSPVKGKLIYTYSNLNTWRTCPEQMRARYIDRELKFVETPEMKWGNEVHTAFEHRVGSSKPLPENMVHWEPFAAAFDERETLKVEQKLGLTRQAITTDFWADDCWFRGKLDLTLVNGTTAYLLDWKTGNSKYEDPFELETGALLLARARPEITKIKGQYAWLKENRLGQLYDLSDVKKTFVEVQRIAAEIELARSPAGSGYEKKRNGLCNAHCDVLTCEHNGRRR